MVEKNGESTPRIVFEAFVISKLMTSQNIHFFQGRASAWRELLKVPPTYPRCGPSIYRAFFLVVPPTCHKEMGNARRRHESASVSRQVVHGLGALLKALQSDCKTAAVSEWTWLGSPSQYDVRYMLG